MVDISIIGWSKQTYLGALWENLGLGRELYRDISSTMSLCLVDTYNMNFQVG